MLESILYLHPFGIQVIHLRMSGARAVQRCQHPEAPLHFSSFIMEGETIYFINSHDLIKVIDFMRKEKKVVKCIMEISSRKFPVFFQNDLTSEGKPTDQIV